MVASGLRICRIVDMERTHAFQEDVLAYPAITVLEKSPAAEYFEFASAESVSDFLYYITGKDERSLKLLAALLMSDFIKSQPDNLSNHMNGGYARWQSQYLKKLRVPQLSALSECIASDLLVAYDRCDYGSINRIVERMVADTRRILPNAGKYVAPRQGALVMDFS